MNTSYNLRSSQRRSASVRGCYLKGLPGSISPETVYPRVHLKRLKVLESPDCQNCRFFLKKDRIMRKTLGEKRCGKKVVLKSFCTILLLVTSFIYWKDDLQWYGLDTLKRISTLHNTMKKYYINTVETHKNDFQKLNIIQPNKSDGNSKLTPPSSYTMPPNFTVLHNSIEIRKLIRDHFVEPREKIKSMKKTFIEEQCEREFGIKLTDNFQTAKSDIYSSNYFNLENITDYALESQGAKIVSVFDTEPYGTLTMKFLNFDFGSQFNNFIFKYFTSRGPTSILVPWRKAGDCWAFKGSHGRVQVELSERITVTAFTIDHIPKERSPSGNIESAPKKFSIFGIDKNVDEEPPRTLLGQYEYKILGPSLQTFPVDAKLQRPYKNIEFIVESNHGNNVYTCIYKIRVHGHK